MATDDASNLVDGFSGSFLHLHKLVAPKCGTRAGTLFERGPALSILRRGPLDSGSQSHLLSGRIFVSWPSQHSTTPRLQSYLLRFGMTGPSWHLGPQFGRCLEPLGRCTYCSRGVSTIHSKRMLAAPRITLGDVTNAVCFLFSFEHLETKQKTSHQEFPKGLVLSPIQAARLPPFVTGTSW